MDTYAHRMDMTVRDYELDMQGIVNNSVYQNYLEHARHEYIKTLGLDFSAYAARGINLVVVRAEVDYKFPLKSGDAFWVGSRLVRESPARFAFYQDIYRSGDDKPVVKAKIIGTALNARGRPEIPDELARVCEIVE